MKHERFRNKHVWDRLGFLGNSNVEKQFFKTFKSSTEIQLKSTMDPTFFSVKNCHVSKTSKFQKTDNVAPK